MWQPHVDLKSTALNPLPEAGLPSPLQACVALYYAENYVMTLTIKTKPLLRRN
jgi:hypothetical protein